MPYRTFIAALACLAFPALAADRSAELKLPSFAHLQQKATETVDITLPLGIVSGLMNGSDPQSIAMKKAIEGLKTVQVRSYQFASDSAYSKADIDAVRSQLSGPGWTPLVQTRDKKQNEDVDIYVALDHDKATGLAIVVCEPREFTIVNIVGSIDLKQLAALQKQLHLPAAALERISQRAP